MLQDRRDPLAERGREVLEDEVRVGLRDGAARGGGQVVAQEDVVQGEGGRGAVRQVGDGERGRGPPVLVQEDHVRDLVRLGAVDQVREDQGPAVQPDRGRQQEADFLGEGGEAGRGGARGGDDGAGVDNPA